MFKVLFQVVESLSSQDGDSLRLAALNPTNHGTTPKVCHWHSLSSDDRWEILPTQLIFPPVQRSDFAPSICGIAIPFPFMVPGGWFLMKLVNTYLKLKHSAPHSRNRFTSQPQGEMSGQHYYIMIWWAINCESLYPQVEPSWPLEMFS